MGSKRSALSETVQNYAPTQAEYKSIYRGWSSYVVDRRLQRVTEDVEEPRKNVVFILATTEPHKIPATIISRTQRFDFKRINTQDIVDHLKTVLDGSQIAYEEEALQVIARAAEGGMRDALSIADQAIAFSDGKVTTQDALEVTGSFVLWDDGPFDAIFAKTKQYQMH